MLGMSLGVDQAKGRAGRMADEDHLVLVKPGANAFDEHAQIGHVLVKT